jgi:predicted Zn-ribbon and HTH transcriptional regulator
MNRLTVSMSLKSIYWHNRIGVLFAHLRKVIKMNDLKWVKIGEEKCYKLYDSEDKGIAVIFFDRWIDSWVFDYSDYHYEFKSDSDNEAIWRATVMLVNLYNEEISSYIKRRNHLLNLSELYGKVLINTVSDMVSNLSYNNLNEEDSFFFCEQCSFRFEDDDIDDKLKKCPKCNCTLENIIKKYK